MSAHINSWGATESSAIRDAFAREVVDPAGYRMQLNATDTETVLEASPALALRFVDIATFTSDLKWELVLTVDELVELLDSLLMLSLNELVLYNCFGNTASLHGSILATLGLEEV